MSKTSEKTQADCVCEQCAQGIFGPQEDEIIEGWRKLHNKELHNLYSSLTIIRMIKPMRMRGAGHVTRMEAKLNGYRILMGKPEGKRPQERPRCRWKNNIEMDLTERGWCGMGWIDLAQHMDQWSARVNMVMNLRLPCCHDLLGCVTYRRGLDW
jgi:hypothetical protein